MQRKWPKKPQTWPNSLKIEKGGIAWTRKDVGDTETMRVIQPCQESLSNWTMLHLIRISFVFILLVSIWPDWSVAYPSKPLPFQVLGVRERMWLVSSLRITTLTAFCIKLNNKWIRWMHKTDPLAMLDHCPYVLQGLEGVLSDRTKLHDHITRLQTLSN